MKLNVHLALLSFSLCLILADPSQSGWLGLLGFASLVMIEVFAGPGEPLA